MIVADQRWIGDHGIGRFARHVLKNLSYRPVPLTSHPAAPLDAARLSVSLRSLTDRDLFFSPGYNSPLLCPAPFIFTIHDMSHIYCPENSSALIRLYYATIMKRACRRALRILTVSDFTCGQILEWSGLPQEKVSNVSCGVDSQYHPGGDLYGLDCPYLLCVSNRKLHKNEFRVVQAFGRSGLAAEVRLVFTGHPTKELAECIDRHHLGSQVIFVGPVVEARLPALYRGAEALVFPSLYEGFGLPLLEALACGTPVVTSNVTAMPEIAGDAALLVDPTAIDEIAAAMKKIVSDTVLRQQLREKAIARAAHYTWAKTSGMVHSILANPAGG
jgi:glycosyltransferase involved in cell wall biosynthesis